MAQIKVTVQEASRLAAITNLSDAVLHLARALNATPRVIITNCHINSSDTAISIDTSPDVYETTIYNVDDDLGDD